MEWLSVWLLLAQLINFLVLFLLFKKFLWDKITKEILDRREMLNRVSNMEEESKKKLLEAEKEADKMLKDAKVEALEIVDTAKSIADKKSNEILEKAQDEAKATLDKSLRDFEKEKSAMMGALKEKVLNVALKVNEKLFWEKANNKDYIEKNIDEIKL